MCHRAPAGAEESMFARRFLVFALVLSAAPALAQDPGGTQIREAAQVQTAAQSAAAPATAQPEPAPIQSSAQAQGSQAAVLSAPAQVRPSEPAIPVTAGWQDGFFIQSANGDFRLQVGLLVHADGRFGVEDANGAIPDTFAFRRLRPNLRGRFS